MDGTELKSEASKEHAERAIAKKIKNNLKMSLIFAPCSMTFNIGLASYR